MPRKYHRPPDTASRRRKARKTAIPFEFEAPPVETTSSEDALDDGNGAAVAIAQRERTVPPTDSTPKGERHIAVDYRYVRAEIVRIAAIMSFLIIALVITSIFR